MIKIGEFVVLSEVVNCVEDGFVFVKKIGFFVIIRLVYIFGGIGGGIVNNEEEFVEIVRRGFLYSFVY